MSYTAPQYVDTKEQAVLALASVIADEDKTNLGNGSVNRALDILADVLAQQDVSVPQTNAGAILALAQYASGMVKPEGTIAITENGEGIDVAQYATADVSVSGGGGSAMTDVYLWNYNQDEISQVVPTAARYLSGFDGENPTYTQLAIEPTTTAITYEGELFTIYGVKMEDVPAGAELSFTLPAGYEFSEFGYPAFFYVSSLEELITSNSAFPCARYPIDGYFCAGWYNIQVVA